MKKLCLLIITLFVIMTFGCKNHQELNCSVDLEILKENIKSITHADSVNIYTKRYGYCREIRSPVIEIENATMRTLDFKALPIDKYQRDDNGYDLDQGLKIEGYVIANLLIDHCDMSKFNDLIIEFTKRDNSGEPMYHFICHYDEFIPKKEPNKLVCNTNIELLKEEIKSATKADTVLIFTHQFDIYLHKIIAPVIVIENATMKSFDFKPLPTDKYQEIGGIYNYHEISDNLKIEGYPFAKQLAANCNMRGFHSIVVDFIKRDSLGYPMYHFRCLYDELLN